MHTPKPNPIVHLLPSLTDVAFLMPIALLFLRMEGAKRLLGDGDTGWHLRAGEWILANGTVPRVDLFSFTKPDAPWYAWEWLWDVAFAWLYRLGGMALVVLASMLVLSLTFTLLFRLVRRHCGNVLIAFGVTFAATAGSSFHWLARPHLFTLLFVVVFAWLLESARLGKTRLLFWLPLLTVIWTNLHGGFFVGILLIGCYAAGELAQWLVEKDPIEARAALARSKPFLLAAAVSAVATLLNPYTYRLHMHLFQFLTGSFHLRYISEYQPTDFQNNLAPWYEPLLLLGVVAAVWCFYRRRFAQGFMVAGWLHLGLFSVRNLPIYLLVAAPAVAGMLQELVQVAERAPLAAWVGRSVRAFENFSREFGANDSIPRWHLVSVVCMVLVAGIFYTPAPPPSFRAEYDPKQYPEAALSVLRDQSVTRSIFADDEWGDYLIYRLYPNTRVFVDGRFDLYGEDFTKKYLDLLNAKFGWQETLDKYRVDTVLLRVDAPLTGALKESRRWRPVYDDGIAIVFRSRTTPAIDANPAEAGAMAGLTSEPSVFAAHQRHEAGGRDPQSDLTKWRSTNE
jgi:hypothetical protein